MKHKNAPKITRSGADKQKAELTLKRSGTLLGK